jgi:hypothetical protein
MGFTIPERRSAKLTFEATEWAGAEVRVLLDAPLSVVLFIEESQTDDDITSRDIFAIIADEILLSWNLEDADGNPIPSDIMGMMKVPRGFMTLLMKAYYEEVSAVPAPLDGPLQNGTQSPEGLTLELANASANLPPSNGRT